MACLLTYPDWFRVVRVIEDNLGNGEELRELSPHRIVDEGVKTSPRAPSGGFSSSASVDFLRKTQAAADISYPPQPRRSTEIDSRGRSPD
jgi:hypothetical protein